MLEMIIRPFYVIKQVFFSLNNSFYVTPAFCMLFIYCIVVCFLN